jgi:hypothetical protein
MESRFELNPEIRVEIADFLKSEFPNEGLIQELYELQFKGRTTDRAMDGIFNLNEVAKHYAQELGVKVSTTEELRLGRGWGCYDWNNPKKWISGCMNAHIPYVILEDNDLVSFCLAAHGKKIKIMGLSYGIIGDMTKVPNEYHTNLKLMSPTNPFEDPFLKELISRYDNPVGKKFTSSVDYCTVGLRYEDPKHVLEQACQSDSNIIHRFGV